MSLGDDLFERVEPSKWGTILDNMNTRPKAWISRYANRLKAADIAPDQKPYEERRMDKFQENGWRNTPIFEVEVPTVVHTPVQLHEVKGQKELMYSANIKCSYCWSSVSCGINRLECHICKILSHKSCAKNVHLYADNGSKDATSTSHLPPISNNNIPESTLRIKWICMFCEDDVSIL